MARKYLAFLGAGPYIVCNYQFQQTETRTRFVQVALTKTLCRKWTDDDYVWVFTTAAAKQNNWFASPICENVGLVDELQQLRLPCPYDQKNIPEGRSEDELWEIFDIVFKQLHSGDEIIFDVTHAFRSLPMLALIILNHARMVNSCKLSGIYYGAMEAKGTRGDLEKLSIEKRKVPVFDLTPFVSILDWTAGIDRFLKTGRAEMISELLTQEAVPRILKTSRGEQVQHANNLRNIAKSTLAFAQNNATCRGKSLSDSALLVQQHLTDAIQSSEHYVKPLKPLLGQMQFHFQVFHDNQEMCNIFEIVTWCLEHNMIQQGLTILQEGIITDICHRLGLDADNYHECRKVVSTAIKVISMNSPQREARYNKNHPHLQLNTIRPHLPSGKFIRAFERLRKARNEISHGGYSKHPRKARGFHQTLKHALQDLREAYLMMTQHPL